MISATPGTPIHSDELARIAYLRTYAYAAAHELLHKYHTQYANANAGSPDAINKFALEVVMKLIARDGNRFFHEANTTWASAKLVAELSGGGEVNSEDDKR